MSADESSFSPAPNLTPGPRTVIRLDIAQRSIQSLLEGRDVVRLWVEREPGDEHGELFSLHATETVAETRRHDGVAASDVLVEILNEIRVTMAAAQEAGEAVPEPVRAAYEQGLARWQQYLDQAG